MDRLAAIPLRIGAWRGDPRTGQLSREGEVVRVEARTLRLLVYLAQRAGEVVGQDELLEQVWSGVVVTQDSVYQGVASLRRILGDDPKQPTYIATVPRLGYRMVASVSPWVDGPETLDLAVASVSASIATPSPADPTAPVATAKLSDPAGPTPPADSAVPAASAVRPPRRRVLVLAALVAIALVVSVALIAFNSKLLTYRATGYGVPARSVGVLPFLDLTSESMNEEYFADGMTEELIGQLARIPGLHVPPPTASFYFKGKQTTVNAVARSLGVAYVLDGSVRKSDTTLRISARLILASDGYVVWSNTYDRPEGDRLKVQQNIAAEVAKALPAAIQ